MLEIKAKKGIIENFVTFFIQLTTSTEISQCHPQRDLPIAIPGFIARKSPGCPPGRDSWPEPLGSFLHEYTHTFTFTSVQIIQSSLLSVEDDIIYLIWCNFN